MALAFENKRVIDEADMTAPWLADALPRLSPDEREQLHAVLQRYGITYTDAELASLTYRALPQPLRAVAECPIEWWDVVDDDGRLRFRIWLYAADAGCLFDRDTPAVIAGEQIQRGAFYGEGYEGETPGSLADLLDQAQAELDDDDSELAGVAFVNR